MQFTQIENLKNRDGRQAPELSKRITILDGHLKREEVTVQSASNSAPLPAGIEPHVSIQDSKQNKTIFLLPEKKKFIDPVKTAFASDYVQWLKSEEQPGSAVGKVNVFAAINFPEEKAARLPLKELDGQLVFGKHAEEKTQRGDYIDTRDWTIWIDAFSTHIVRGEVKLTSTDPAIGEVTYVLKDFVDGAPVEQSLFSTDPPADYKQISLNWSTEHAVAEGKSDGTSGPSHKKTEFVFADVQEEVAKTKSAQYSEIRTNWTKDGKYTDETKADVKILGSAIERRDVTSKVGKQPPGSLLRADEHYVQIYDAATGKQIFLQPDSKTYSIPQLVMSVGDDLKVTSRKIDNKPHPEADFYVRIRDLAADPVRRLPEKVIDGKKAVGFVYEDKHESPYGVDTSERTYWVDADTKLPVRIEIAARSTNPTRAQSDWVLKNFVFDASMN
jgi:outer membrane lipoprotein-sorting protein